MRDFTAEEKLLFATNIGMPFSDHVKVSRAVVSDTTAKLANQTPAKWFSSFCRALSETDINNTKKKAKLWADFALQAQKSLELPSKPKKGPKLPSLIALNLCDWAADILDEMGWEGGTVSGIAMRRLVMGELAAEADAGGNWEIWLTHVDWINITREQALSDVALTPWVDYIKSEESIGSSKRGSDLFVDWLQDSNNEEEEESEDADTDSPLGEDGSQPTSESPSEEESPPNDTSSAD